MTDNRPADNSNNKTQLEFKIGPLLFCAPALEVVAIISPPKIIQIPLSSNVIAGCFNYQGETATILSLHNKFGLPFTLEKKMSHIILANVHGELNGFWVDIALDVSSADNFQSIADYAPNEKKAYANFMTRGDEIFLQTSFQRLHDCDRSDLNWLTRFTRTESDLTCEDNETDIDEILTTDKSINEEPIDNAPLNTTVSVEGSQGNNETDNILNTTGKPERHTNFTFDHLDQALKNSRHDSDIRSSHYSRFSTSIDLVPHSHADTVIEEIEHIENKKRQLLPAFISLIILLLASFATISILDSVNHSLRNSSKVANKKSPLIENRAEIHRPVKPEATHIKPQATIVTTQADLKLEPESETEAEAGTSTHNLDEAVVETAAKNTRIFELHIDEESAPSLYQVTDEKMGQPVTDSSSVKRFTHVVVKGDTLWHITQRYLDNPHRYPELAKASDINNPHRIYPGDIIKIIVTTKL